MLLLYTEDKQNNLIHSLLNHVFWNIQNLLVLLFDKSYQHGWAGHAGQYATEGGG